MSALRFLPSLASARGIGFPRSPLRLICKGRPSLYLRSKGHGAQVAGQSFHNTAIRYISQANKDKVIERNEAIKRDSTIEVRVKKIISEQLGVKADEVVNTASFVEDLGADSLDTVELVMALEEEFDTEIPEEEAEKITTMQAAIDYINSYKG